MRMKVCPQCGRSFKSDRRFCTDCGVYLPSLELPPARKEEGDPEVKPDKARESEAPGPEESGDDKDEAPAGEDRAGPAAWAAGKITVSRKTKELRGLLFGQKTHKPPTGRKDRKEDKPRAKTLRERLQRADTSKGGDAKGSSARSRSRAEERMPEAPEPREARPSKVERTWSSPAPPVEETEIPIHSPDRASRAQTEVPGAGPPKEPELEAAVPSRPHRGAPPPQPAERKPPILLPPSSLEKTEEPILGKSREIEPAPTRKTSAAHPPAHEKAAAGVAEEVPLESKEARERKPRAPTAGTNLISEAPKPSVAKKKPEAPRKAHAAAPRSTHPAKQPRGEVHEEFAAAVDELLKNFVPLEPPPPLAKPPVESREIPPVEALPPVEPASRVAETSKASAGEAPATQTSSAPPEPEQARGVDTATRDPGVPAVSPVAVPQTDLRSQPLRDLSLDELLRELGAPGPLKPPRDEELSNPPGPTGILDLENEIGALAAPETPSLGLPLVGIGGSPNDLAVPPELILPEPAVAEPPLRQEDTALVPGLSGAPLPDEPKEPEADMPQPGHAATVGREKEAAPSALPPSVSDPSVPPGIVLKEPSFEMLKAAVRRLHARLRESGAAREPGSPQVPLTPPFAPAREPEGSAFRPEAPAGPSLEIAPDLSSRGAPKGSPPGPAVAGESADALVDGESAVVARRIPRGATGVSSPAERLVVWTNKWTRWGRSGGAVGAPPYECELPLTFKNMSRRALPRILIEIESPCLAGGHIRVELEHLDPDAERSIQLRFAAETPRAFPIDVRLVYVDTNENPFAVRAAVDVLSPNGKADVPGGGQPRRPDWEPVRLFPDPAWTRILLAQRMRWDPRGRVDLREELEGARSPREMRRVVYPDVFGLQVSGAEARGQIQIFLKEEATLGAEPRRVDVLCQNYPLGRQTESANAMIDKRHARIEIEDGAVVLRDLGGTHGTSADGRRLGNREKVALHDGSVVNLGGSFDLIVREFRDRSSSVRARKLDPLTANPIDCGRALETEEPANAGDPLLALRLSRMRNWTGKLEYVLLVREADIGSSDACAIVVRSSRVAEVHARLRLRGGVLELMDLGSIDGTWVGGKKLEAFRPTQLLSDSELTIGDVRMRLGPLDLPA